MGRKKKRKDKGVLEYVSVKNRKNVKALIRELGLELVSVERIPMYYNATPAMNRGCILKGI